MDDESEEEELQMKIILKGDFLQDVVDALDALVDEATFQFLDDLLRVWVIDPANVAACYMDIHPDQRDQIQHYSTDPDGFRMGLNLGKLDELLGYANAGDLLQIEFGQKHNWCFNITMPGVDVDLGGIDPDAVRQDPDHPGLEDELSAFYRMEGSTLNDAVDLNDMFSDHSTIVVEDHQVKMIASGDTDSGTYSLKEGEGELEFLDGKHPDERVESMFSLDYLKDMSKVLKGYDEVKIRSGDEMPVLIETELFEYMLAPRIKSS